MLTSVIGHYLRNKKGNIYIEIDIFMISSVLLVFPKQSFFFLSFLNNAISALVSMILKIINVRFCLTCGSFSIKDKYMISMATT